MASSVDCTAGPVANPSISGVGVRVSLYAQGILLALLSSRSSRQINQSAVTESLGILITTNIALCLAILYLGFKAEPEVDLYDALVVSYVLSFSFLSIIFTLPRYRFRANDPHLKWFAVFQAYLVLGTLFAIFWEAPRFGRSPGCNQYRRMVLFGTFSATHSGRTFGVVMTILIIVLYTAGLVSQTWGGYRYRSRRRTAEPIHIPELRHPEVPAGDTNVANATPSEVSPAEVPRYARTGGRPGSVDSDLTDGSTLGLNIDGRVILHLIVISVVATLAILNTELLVRHNHPQADPRSWDLSQFILMALLVLPLKRTIQVFWLRGISKALPHERLAVLRQEGRLPSRDRRRSVIQESGTNNSTSNPLANVFNALDIMVPRQAGSSSEGGAYIEEWRDEEDDDQGRETLSQAKHRASQSTHHSRDD